MAEVEKLGAGLDKAPSAKMMEDVRKSVEATAITLDKEDADFLRDRAKALVKVVDDSYDELGGVLYKIAASKAYMDFGWETFKEYVEGEVGYSIRKAEYLMSIWYALEYRYPPEYRDKIRGIGWCLAGEQVIECKTGRKAIQDAVEGDIVLDADGSWTQVTEHGKHRAGGFIFEIQAAKIGAIRASFDHSFPIIKNGQRELINGQRELINGRRRKTGFRANVKRVKAWDIDKGDLLLVPFPRTDVSAGRFRDMPMEFFELAGWYVAEGFTIPEGQIRITFGRAGRAVRDRLRDIAEKLYPDYSVKTYDSREPSYRVSISGGFQGKNRTLQLHRTFDNWFGKGSANKTFPDEFFGVSRECRTEFLRALWQGDGSASKKGYWLVTTTSYQLACKVRLLTMTLGILPGLSQVRQKSKNRLPMWAVTISSGDAEKLFGLPVTVKRPTREYIVLPTGYGVPVRSHHKLEWPNDTVYHIGTQSGMFCCPAASYNTKAKDLIQVADETDLDEWLEKAEEMNATEFTAEVKKAKDIRSGSETISIRKTFGFSEAQWETIEKALELAATMSGSVSPSRCLELVSLDFLTNNEPDATVEKKVGGWLEKIERITGVKYEPAGADSGLLINLLEQVVNAPAQDVRAKLYGEGPISTTGPLTAKELLIFLRRKKDEEGKKTDESDDSDDEKPVDY